MASEPKTIRVRIAVAVDADGDWSACGWAGADDPTMSASAIEGPRRHPRLHWIEATVPAPVETVIEGEVSDGE